MLSQSRVDPRERSQEDLSATLAKMPAVSLVPVELSTQTGFEGDYTDTRYGSVFMYRVLIPNPVAGPGEAETTQSLTVVCSAGPDLARSDRLVSTLLVPWPAGVLSPGPMAGWCPLSWSRDRLVSALLVP